MKTLLSEAQVRAGVVRMAAEIRERLGPGPLTIIGVLTGSLVLLADLIRLLDMPLRVGVIQASSYRGETERGQLQIQSELLPDLAGHRVLLVDDIFDTGHTLVAVCDLIRGQRPVSVHSAVLLRKRGRQQVAPQPDFVAFEIPNTFVVGYGLDYRDAYRNLPYVAVLEPHELADRAE